ncbi:MAG: DUF1761 domain-containing protein [Saprospiraceae bacterium]
MEVSTNWLAIVASVIVGMLLGFLWYGMLFNSQWMAGNGFTIEGDKMFKNGAEIPMSATPMIFNTVAILIYALIMNWLLNKMNISSWQSGALAGGVIGLLMAIGILTGNMFAHNPMSLSMVDGSYSLLLFVLIGAIVGGWRKK